MLVDFYLFRRGRYTLTELYENTGVRWAGLLAYAVGILASVPFMSRQLFTGPIARSYLQGADISYYVGFLVAGALYLVLGRQRVAERRAAQERPLGTDRARTAGWRLAAPSTVSSVRRDEPSQVG